MPTVTTPPREVLAAATRKAIEDHTEWDSLHCFMTLHWDGENLHPGTYAAIDPGIDPPDYPALMAGIAAKELENNPEDPAYAYLLQIEGFGVVAPGPDASETEREQFDRDRLESAFAYCADVHGRLWAATKARSKPDVIEENFYPPGKHLSGQMIRGLLTVAYAAGVKAYGLPGPQNAWN
jgi:hypothetical protein